MEVAELTVLHHGDDSLAQASLAPAERSPAHAPEPDVPLQEITEDGETPMDTNLPPEKKHRRGRERILIDVHNQVASAARSPENEYERERMERIRRNAEVMHTLGLRQLATELATAPGTTAPGTTAAAAPKPQRRRTATSAPRVRYTRTRQSSRVHAAAEGGSTADAAPSPSNPAPPTAPENNLLDLEDYFKLNGKDVSGAIRTDGVFRGWVNPQVAEACGIAGDAAAAWAAGGGGSFSYKINSSAIPAGVKARGWSEARAWSFTQLRKNPNTYFYRHVAPDEAQAQGEWTPEEHAAFLATARMHGVGDKWGLFASYIPQRVGYQCSAYYREVIIPQGLVLDPRFMMQRNGKAVYVG